MEPDPTKNTDQLKPVPTIGRDEMNLAEYPFGVLSKRVSKNQKTIKIDLGMVRNKEGKLVPQRWIVTGSDEFGLPVGGDEEVYVGLMAVTQADTFRSREVAFVQNKLLKLMGWPTTGVYYERIKQALNRLLSMAILAENVFWDNENKCYKTKGFHILESYTLYDEGRDWRRTKKQPISKIVWSEELWQSFLANNIKKLDTEFWFSLKGSITKRLYRYLDKHFYRSPVYTIGLKALAFNHLGMPETYYPSQIKQKLFPACDQLVERGYLEKYFCQQAGGEGEEIVFLKSSQLTLPMPEEKEAEPSAQERDDPLVAELVQRRVTESTARRLCEKYDQKRITEKIELFDYLKEVASPLVEKNPAGYLRRAIEEDYQPPDGFTTKAEREEKQRKQAEQRQRDERKRKETEYREWLAKLDDEKIKGPLFVWKQRFKREQDREPTEEEREAKRQELISGLPELERKLFGDLVGQAKVGETRPKDKRVKPRKKRPQIAQDRRGESEATSDTTLKAGVHPRPPESVLGGVERQPTALMDTRRHRVSFLFRMVKRLPFGERINRVLEGHVNKRG